MPSISIVLTVITNEFHRYFFKKIPLKDKRERAHCSVV